MDYLRLILSKPATIYLGIILFVFIIYGNSIDNEYSVDDNLVVQGVQKIEKGIVGIPELFTTNYISTTDQNYGYRPIVLTTFAIEKTLFGHLPESQNLNKKKFSNRLTQANVSHFINVLLYIITCLFLYHLLTIIFKNDHAILPLLITILFAAHPLHTEPVANLKSRDELLMFLATLGALYYFLKYALQTNYIHFGLALFSFSIAIFSKKSALSLIGILPVVFYYSKISWKKIVICLSCIIVLLVILVATKKNLVSSSTNRILLHYENPLFVKSGFWDHIQMGLFTSWHYLTKLIFPKDLTYYYGYNTIPIDSWSSYKIWGALAFHSVFGIIGIKKLINREVLGIGIALWFGVMLAFLNIVTPLVGIVADRFTYIFSLGYCIVLGALIVQLHTIVIQKRKKLSYVIPIITIAILLFYSYRVIIRNVDWENRLTLFRHDINVVPNSAKCHSMLASHLFEKQQREPNAFSKEDVYPEIIRHYKKAIEIDSTFINVYNNLGTTYLGLEDGLDKGIYYCNQAIELNPNYLEAHINLANAYEKSGYIEAALNSTLKIVELRPYTMDSFRALRGFLRRNPNKLQHVIGALIKLSTKIELPKLIYMNIAALYSSDTSTYNLSIEFLEKAFILDTTDTALCAKLIQYHTNKGNQEKIKFYKKFLS